MEVSTANSVKVYNLSSGKSVPEWLNERKRRQLLKKNPEMQRRVQLLQDFDMPVSSSQVSVSADGNYIVATGLYKPCVKCYDVNQLSLKFERGLDSEVVKFRILSEDYSKLAFLQADRYVELHVRSGTYFRIRVPSFGRDMAYHPPSCELYVAGTGPEVYRINLELGHFMSPLLTQSSSNNVCAFNPNHYLLAVGNQDAVVECWDPRSKVRAGSLHLMDSGFDFGFRPAVTALSYDGPLTLGVGTSTGQILLYDIRSTKPLVAKDHNYELPIKGIAFNREMNLVLSVDAKCLKIWHRASAAPYASIEPQNDISNLCYLNSSGLVLMACQDSKMLAYYIPSIGKAPKWCYFLDNLTEELEEDATPSVYDDYKFVTDQELNTLGLSHLKGTNLLRAYMHGYFINIRLYKRAKSITEPFAYSEYRKKRIEEKLEKDRATRIKQKKLPRINKQFAIELLQNKKNRHNELANPLGDDRFASMFQEPEFEMNTESEEYQLLHPIISCFQKNVKRKLEKLKLKNPTGNEDNNDSEREGEVSDDSSLEDYFIQSSGANSETEETGIIGTATEDTPIYREGRDVEFVQKHKVTKETLESRLKKLETESEETQFNEMADIRFKIPDTKVEPQIPKKLGQTRDRKARRPAKSYLPKIKRVDWNKKRR